MSSSCSYLREKILVIFHKNRSRTLWFLIIFGALLLTACDPATITSTMVNITFTGEGQVWTATIEVHILPEGIEDAAATFPGLISNLEEQARIAGVDAAVDWQAGEVDEEGNTIYFVAINGETLDELNALLSLQAAFTPRLVDEETRWYFQLDPDDLIPETINNWQLQINGREIVTGNGQILDQNSMRWDDARSDMTAVMIADQQPAIVWPYLIIALCVVGILATFLHQRGAWHFPAWFDHK